MIGRPDAAAAAKLFVVAAGAPEAVAACLPLFEAVGQRTFHIGDQPPLANLVKLSGNFLLASAIEALGEAVALVAKAGVDRRQYVDLLTATLFAAPAYRTYGGLIAEQRFEPAGFAAPLGAKDIRLTLAAAEGLRVPMPLASLLHDRFLALLAQAARRSTGRPSPAWPRRTPARCRAELRPLHRGLPQLGRGRTRNLPSRTLRASAPINAEPAYIKAVLALAERCALAVTKIQEYRGERSTTGNALASVSLNRPRMPQLSYLISRQFGSQLERT